MKKWNVIVCSILAVLLLAACGNKVDDTTANLYTSKAEEVVHFINNGEFDKVVEQFDERMKESVTAEQLAEITPVLEESGSYEGIKKQSVQEKDGNKIVVIVGEHSEEDRVYTVTFDANDQIAGLYVQ